MLFLLLAESSFAFHAGQLRTSRQPRLPVIHSCAAPPPKPPPKPPQPVETPVAAIPSGQPSVAAEKEKAGKEKGGAEKRQRAEFKGSGMGTKRQEALTVGLFKEGW